MRTIVTCSIVVVLFGCSSAPEVTGIDGGPVSTIDGSAMHDAFAVDAPRTDTSAVRTDAAMIDDAGVGHDAYVAPQDAFFAGDAGPSSSRQTMIEIGTNGAPNGYYEYVPPAYDGTTPMPLLLFWHGQGEDGNGTAAELPRVLRNGPPDLIDADRWPADRPFIVLSPQNGGTGCPSAGTVRTFLRWAFAHYPVDRARVYLTGLSCGAIGGWAYIHSFLTDDEITAAVLIAGNGRQSWTTHGCGLGSIGLWAFHGTSDDTINPDDDMFNMYGFPTDNRPDHNQAASEQTYADWMAAGMPMSDGLLGCPTAGRRDARMTLYPGVGHNSWARTYDGSAGHDIYTWLLSMSR